MAVSPIFMLSFSGLIGLLSLGNGLPLGLPPAPEDPLLFQMAPEKCLYYVTWAGRAEADPASRNRTERLLAHPELRHWAVTVLDRVRKSPVVENAPQGEFLIEMVAASLATWWTQPSMLFVEHWDWRAPREIKAGVVVKLPEGPAGEPVAAWLNRLTQQLGSAIKDFEVDGSTFQKVLPTPDGPEVAWGIHRGYLCCGVGKSVLEELLPRMTTPVPNWLAALSRKCAVERRASLAHLDVAALLESARSAGDAPWLDVPELQALRGLTFATGLEGEGFVSRTWISLGAPAGGLWASLGGQPLEPKHLQHIPADATLAVAGRGDMAELLDKLAAVASQLNPWFETNYAQFMDQWQREFGFHLRDQLLPCLGDVWTLHAAPSEGGLLTGWTLTVSVKDPQALAKLNTGLADRFTGELRLGEPRVATSVTGDRTWSTFYVPDDDVPMAPSWCLTDQHLVMALFPQAIKAHLERTADDLSLAAEARVQHAFAEEVQPAKLVYVDTRAVVRLVYPWLQIFGQRFLAEMQNEGWDVDIGLLPSLASLDKSLDPAISTIAKTADGWLFESRQTMPAGNLGASAPLAVAALLPAIQSSRQAAQRAAGMNNLRQILLALLNHESAMQALPAAFSTNPQGQPLLSWRVHILPFLEEQQLYDQFHLDEPWDSPHNRQLIPQMPRVYSAPGSLADPGKTNYLGVRGERGMLQPPVDDQVGRVRPQGTRLREVRDGTSNTICVVEASDELAVIWTKPDDYDPQLGLGARVLSGLRPRGFLAGFVDGHVSFIADQINPETLQALFTKDGGEVVEAH